MLGIQLADLDLRKGLAHFVAKLRWLGASLGRELLGSARGKQREGYSSLPPTQQRQTLCVPMVASLQAAGVLRNRFVISVCL